MKYIGILLLLLISACQSKHVTIISQGYDTKQLQRLEHDLTNQGWVVSFNHQVTIPQTFTHTAIALNPIADPNKDLLQLKQIISQYQLTPITEYRFAQGHHFYNEGYFGLYLRHPNYKIEQIPAFLMTENCQTASTISFNADHSSLLEYETAQGELSHIKGIWQFNYNQLLFSYQGNIEQIWHKTKIKRETYKGMQDADLYKATRISQIKQLNCDLIIIHMDLY